LALTYNELVTALQDYTENYETTFVTNIPTFIRQAEQRIINVVEHPEFKKNSTGTLTIGNRYLATPDDFLAPFELIIIDTLGAYHNLLQKDVSWIREAYPDPATTGIADYYAIFDQSTFILPRGYLQPRWCLSVNNSGPHRLLRVYYASPHRRL